MSIDVLRQLCAAREHDARVQLILSLLHGTPRIQKYQIKNDWQMGGYDEKYPETQELSNIYSMIDGGEEKTIAITVHHDIANVESENCLDNNASVLNLINLHNRLVLKKDKLRFNVLVAFLDGEELVNPWKCGVNHLLHHFDVDQLIDLELTAFGDQIVIHKYGEFDIFDYPSVPGPPQIAAFADWWKKEDPEVKCRGAACVTSMDQKAYEKLQRKGRADHWFQCHRDTDTVDKWAKIDDMRKFVDVIYNHLVVPKDAPEQPKLESLEKRLDDLFF